MKEEAGKNPDIIAILAKVFLFIKRYFIILLVFLLIGVALGVYKKYAEKGFYTNHIIFNSKVVPNAITLDLVKSLQTYINYGNINSLAEKLNVSPDIAFSIISIDTGSFRSKKMIGFWIDVKLRENYYADSITKGLEYYLNNNEYILSNTAIYLQEKKNILNMINEKLISIDSINSKVSNHLSTTGSENAIIVRSYASEYINLIEKKYETEREIKFGCKINVVEKYLNTVNAGRSLTKSVIMYGLGIFIIGIFLCLFIESLRLVRIYIKKQNAL